MNELNHWISSIRKTCISNRDLLKMFHPGIYRKCWTCCLKNEKLGEYAGKLHFDAYHVIVPGSPRAEKSACQKDKVLSGHLSVYHATQGCGSDCPRSV